jgi:Uncharacterised protein family (UPF0014)
MMTGAILGGATISQAAKYQQIIMFLISATTTLATTLAAAMCLFVVIDANDRIRDDRVSGKKAWMWRLRDEGLTWAWRGMTFLWRRITCRAAIDYEAEERQREEGYREG